jgi:2,3-bisphosphoglycerate-independent phosphoglycerate mutase
MGNSEVGHLNIGAGRIVYQDLLRIDMSIAEGSFFQNEALCQAIDAVRESSRDLHLMGLVSDGGVHSQIHHLFALLDLARAKQVPRTYIHALLDGRDTPPRSAAGYLGDLQNHINKHSYGRIASVCGRYYAMDRDTRWERIERAYRLFVAGEGRPAADPVQGVRQAYELGQTDEFVEPIVLLDREKRPLATLKDGDGVISFNFRADRAREITRALTQDPFPHFERRCHPQLGAYVCMTSYDEHFSFPIAFPPVRLNKILGEVISENGLRQLRIAETEKYAHVTYFFNGGEEKPFPLEDRCLIPSPRDVSTYDLQPEMSAIAVTEELLRRIDSGIYDLIVLNFANMDMVGHTGVLKAAVRACETVDQCLAKIVSRIKSLDGTALITADHGNSEKMLAENGGPHTAHTVHPVPFVLVDVSRRQARLRQGRLADIAPTVLDIMGVKQPDEMTGMSLIAS